MNVSEAFTYIEIALDYVEFGNISLERRLVSIIEGIERLKLDRQKLFALYTLTDDQRRELLRGKQKT